MAKFEVGEKALYIDRSSYGYSLIPVLIRAKRTDSDRSIKEVVKLETLAIGREPDPYTYNTNKLIKVSSHLIVPEDTIDPRCNSISLVGLNDVETADLSNLNPDGDSLFIHLDGLPNLKKVVWPPACKISRVTACNTPFEHFENLNVDLFSCTQQNNGNFLPHARSIIIDDDEACILWAANKCDRVQVQVGWDCEINNPRTGLFRCKLDFIMQGYKKHARLS